LSGLFLFTLSLCGFFKSFALLLEPLIHVGVIDHPLSRLNGEDRSLWGVGLHSLLTDGEVEGLRSTFLIIELITERSLLSLFVVIKRIFSELSNNGSVNRVE